MLDLKFVREHAEEVKAALRRRGTELDLGRFLALDEKRRRTQQEVVALRQKRSQVSEEIGRLKKAGSQADDQVSEMRAVGDAIATLEAAIREAEEVLDHAQSVADEEDYEIETDLLQARDAGPTIVDEAVERKVDLVVMGVRYKRRFGQFSFGGKKAKAIEPSGLASGSAVTWRKQPVRPLRIIRWCWLFSDARAVCERGCIGACNGKRTSMPMSSERAAHRCMPTDAAGAAFASTPTDWRYGA